MRKLWIAASLMLWFGTGVLAQTDVEVAPEAGLAVPAVDPQTLADIRTEIDMLRGQMSQLRRELELNDPAVTGVANAAPVLSRVDGYEQELRRLTAQVEKLGFDIERIVADGTNRIGDLEFRLTELERGDLSTLGQTAPLGQGDVSPREPQRAPAGEATSPPATDAAPLPTTLTTAPRPQARAAEPAPGVTGAPPTTTAIDAGSVVPAPAPAPEPGSNGDEILSSALSALRAGSYFEAERGFSTFIADFPASPRRGEALFWRGEALAASADWQTAARSYLDSFSGTPEGPYAADALYRLGVALGRLGQTEEACQTLAEVPRRYTAITADLADRITAERAALACR